MTFTHCVLLKIEKDYSIFDWGHIVIEYFSLTLPPNFQIALING